MQSYEHLTLSERESLSELCRQGKGVSEIARLIGRDKSTVSREVRRNKSKSGTYHPWRATVLYICRRKKCIRRYRLTEPELRQYVIERLNDFWSPEAIVARWKEKHSGERLSHSTIYASIGKKRLGVIAAKTHLRRRGKRKVVYRGQTIKPERTINERPEAIEQRLRIGDVEGDTISGAIGKGCVVTMVDRKHRMLYAELSRSRDSELIKQAVMKILAGKKILSLTLDNGSEFAKFKEIESESKTKIYFTNPHSPWERGTNENTNGLLRFFFPKGTNFHNVTDEQLQQAVTLINNRPRKCLGWLSPVEFISSKCCT